MTKSKNTQNYENLLEKFQAENDPLVEMLKFIMKQLMEVEVRKKGNSEKGVHDDERTGYCSRYRKRRFDIRVGTIDLEIPKIRNGGYVPFFMKERQRCEQALIHAVHECYMNGVSTRKIEHLAKSLGIESISAGEVSEISFEEIDFKKISSTYTLERLNEEIRRRTDVVGIFPNEKSYIRLVTSHLLEYTEDHLTGASYIKAETLK